ncbi:hypothetical protein MGG_17686 [Pyricularia oryzae 70-15]|uniref:Uncharacterized protein n=4 Tax=Pyricularia oryzae TaxID=318829 RepID=G4NIV4_PYRO7|nr:uncharacterized protein MGG_17686 [Pyricularia oryzae 70-15]ELQ41765.1 hypothetical protein OOU_Y34scaffold00255g63 [Pyricularia oryzae Y34]KAI7916149.1 hypothetical protein M9X92_008027 [Pyricularia oryzae]EHA47360.1 hypothetical protein MGG_17686 [Pyricularia oryzae 70-15]KAI7932510.1 hypothetical protein M0657_000259 [Pyricularia oryzae]QBZ64617.1 hypothetical protein PoMZ_06315 [Pyricularia oryzae]
MPVVCRLSHNYHVVARHSPQFSRLPQVISPQLVMAEVQCWHHCISHGSSDVMARVRWSDGVT